ncbi:hypothetical protein BpHYR1_027781 [Brachionus plicatilis]|uniref:Protein sleepless n=1 Tax=Brachionus plicatilis TaxID=10195 RepID=A0A3M7RUK4_BRAPC|nr:hypothetical protein BpHYR1_027781 [Brachionus plicatilis]
MHISIIFGLVLTLNFIAQSKSLDCYSCSSTAGDRNCHEDSFNASTVKVITCPEGADVCVRAIEVYDKNGKPGGAIFRSCGSSIKASKGERLSLDLYPPYNDCTQPSPIPVESILFSGSYFKVCGVAKDLGNGKGEYDFSKL